MPIVDCQHLNNLCRSSFIFYFIFLSRYFWLESVNGLLMLLPWIEPQGVICSLDHVSTLWYSFFFLPVFPLGRPLPTLCFHLFHQYGLMAHFHLDPVKVWKFFSKPFSSWTDQYQLISDELSSLIIHRLGLVEEGYHSNNPYHNAIHAADVTQAMHCFLQEEKVISVKLICYFKTAVFRMLEFVIGWLDYRCVAI